VTPHLRGHVRAYVDRALPPALLHLYDRHLVCCGVCRDAADRERRIVAALRSETTGVPTSLRSSLLGLAAAPPPEPPAGHGPRIPLPPLGLRPASAPSYDPVPTVNPAAPALHRSPMRAAVVASIAAGASVAAAWGLAASPVSVGRTTSVRVPVVNFGASTATLQSGSMLPVGLRTPTSRSTYGTGETAPVAVSSWVVNRRGVQSYELGPVRFGPVSSAQSAP
jgi:hypothetical protein